MTGKKILVIDDAEFILESTSTLLKFEGYNVFTAPEGLSGIEIAFTNKPDLILCDISMPGMDGYGVLEKLRKNQTTANIPFIFLTAYTEKANMRAGMERGTDDYLVKPYSRNELIAAIDAQWNKFSRIEKHVQEKVEEVGRSVTYALPHEFRTVLNQVVGSAKYLSNTSEEIKPGEIRELADDIISSAQRLMKITENFLAYVKVESLAANPQLRIKLREFRTDEPSAMVFDICSQVADKYHRLQDLVPTRLADQIAIEISTENFHKIIDELFDNAFKFSVKSTKVLLETWVENNYFYFSITDNGRGMSVEQISNIGALMQFERSLYEQQGIGLGLAIAKRLVELHDGSFKIDSREGFGTKVTFRLHSNAI